MTDLVKKKFVEDGFSDSPQMFDGKEYLLSDIPRPGNVMSSKGPRYFRIRMKIKIVDRRVFIKDIEEGKNQQFEYILR